MPWRHTSREAPRTPSVVKDHHSLSRVGHLQPHHLRREVATPAGCRAFTSQPEKQTEQSRGGVRPQQPAGRVLPGALPAQQGPAVSRFHQFWGRCFQRCSPVHSEGSTCRRPQRDPTGGPRGGWELGEARRAAGGPWSSARWVLSGRWRLRSGQLNGPFSPQEQREGQGRCWGPPAGGLVRLGLNTSPVGIPSFQWEPQETPRCSQWAGGLREVQDGQTTGSGDRPGTLTHPTPAEAPPGPIPAGPSAAKG